MLILAWVVGCFCRESVMESELEELSGRWFAAWLAKDAAAVERLAAEDYVYVGPEGWVMDRAAILAVIRSPSYRLERGERSEVGVRMLGDGSAGVVRHRYRGAGEFEGKRFLDDQRCVMVWERRGGEWRLVMEQCSFVGKQDNGTNVKRAESPGVSLVS